MLLGLSPETIKTVIQRVNTLENLLIMNEEDISAILACSQCVQDEDLRRLNSAINNLNRCQRYLKTGSKEPCDMFWDSWDRHNHIRLNTSPRAHHRLNHESYLHQHHNILTSGSSAAATTISFSDHKNSLLLQSPVESTPPDTLLSTSTTPSSEKLLNTISPEDASNNLSPSPSPPNSPSIQLQNSSNSLKSRPHHQHLNRFNPKYIHHLNNNISSINNINSHKSKIQLESVNNNDLLINDVNSESDYSMKPSKSHESQLSSNGQEKLMEPPAPRTITNTSVRYEHDPHEIPSTTVIVSDGPLAAPPRSPCTPVRVMGHMIQHRFTKKFKFTSSTCDLCNKQMFFGFKCTECKYRCHKDCKANVPPSCGLPKEFVDEFRKIIGGGSSGSGADSLIPSNSPNMIRGPGLFPNKRNDVRVRQPFIGPDSSSAGSSCNSSSPSSPALLTIPPQTPATCSKSQFNFPEVSLTNHHLHHTHPSYHQDCILEDASESHPQYQYNHEDQSIYVPEPPPIRPRNNFNNYKRSLTSLINNSQQMMSKNLNDKQAVSENNQNVTRSNLSDSHRSIDSDKTVTSTESDRTPGRLESVEERESSLWPRQNSLSLKEWDIPYDDIKLLDKIGQGRFGTVHRALWHGDVAVKILKEDYLDEHTLEAFKLEVATFKKTRHDNLVLFMGACMKPPRLAIVTSLCKGNTLYTHIHLRKDKFNLNRTTLVAQQISQGMGYLHARGIVHKDLKTKNIFLENEKVIITDFGLFSVTKLLYCEMGLGIPSGWLCYLAPELIKNLKPYRPTNEDLPFSNSSDAFAFGTIWYELLCGEFPFKAQPPESIIWQLGRGMKQSLANLQASRDVKEILMHCWSYQPDDRPDFTNLLGMLERLPKKRLARSPSHPIQLSRSAESVF